MLLAHYMPRIHAPAECLGCRVFEHYGEQGITHVVATHMQQHCVQQALQDGYHVVNMEWLYARCGCTADDSSH